MAVTDFRADLERVGLTYPRGLKIKIEPGLSAPFDTSQTGSIIFHTDPTLGQFTRGLATQICDRFSDEERELWDLKLVIVKSEDLAEIKKILADTKYTTYQSMIEAHSDPVTRLVSIHFINALQQNGLTLDDARQVDISQWGSTESLAQGKSRYSLNPLLGTYADRGVLDYFPLAVTDLVVNNLYSISHTRARTELKDLVVFLFNSVL